MRHLQRLSVGLWICIAGATARPVTPTPFPKLRQSATGVPLSWLPSIRRTWPTPTTAGTTRPMVGCSTPQGLLQLEDMVRGWPETCSWPTCTASPTARSIWKPVGAARNACWRCRTEFEALRPTADNLLDLARAAAPEAPLEALRQWNRSRSGPLVVDQPEYASRMLQFHAGNAYADLLMDTIEVRRVVLGDAPASCIPGYSRRVVGNWAYIHPEKDWYDTPLGPREAVRDRGLKLRLRRQPHFLQSLAPSPVLR